MSNQTIHSVNGGQCDLSVQIADHHEVAELCWDSATKLIRVEVPERATMTQLEQLKMHHIRTL